MRLSSGWVCRNISTALKVWMTFSPSSVNGRIWKHKDSSYSWLPGQADWLGQKGLISDTPGWKAQDNLSGVGPKPPEGLSDQEHSSLIKQSLNPKGHVWRKTGTAWTVLSLQWSLVVAASQCGDKLWQQKLGDYSGSRKDVSTDTMMIANSRALWTSDWG